MSIKTVSYRLDADRTTLMSIVSIIHIIAEKILDDDEDQRDFHHVIGSLSHIENVLRKVTESMEQSHLELFQLSSKYEPEGESG